MTGQTICGAYSAAVAALAPIPQLRSQFQTRRLGGDGPMEGAPDASDRQRDQCAPP
jgi:hypothetical protein